MHIAFATPKPAETGAGGGADYLRSLVATLRGRGHRVDLLTGHDPAFPDDAIPIVDGMLLPWLRARLEELVERDAVVLVHHVSAAAGREEGARDRVRVLETEMLPRLRRVVATSKPVAAQLLETFGVAAHILTPGAHDFPRSQGDAAEPHILAVGVLTPRKGHDLLLRSLARLTDLSWRLTIAGGSTRDPAHAKTIAALIQELGLQQRARLLADPSTDALQAAWCSATLFALATQWEGYPSAIAEALRRGLPVVVTGGDDISAIIPADAGVVVPPSDLPTFGKCLRRALFDRTLRDDMADGAWRAGRALPSWSEQADHFLSILAE